MISDTGRAILALEQEMYAIELRQLKLGSSMEQIIIEQKELALKCGALHQAIQKLSKAG